MSKKPIVLLVVIWLLIWNSLAFASDYGYKEGELLVRFSPKTGNIQTTTAEKNAILDSLGGGEVISINNFVLGLSLVKLPPGTSVKSAVSSFSASAEIDYVQPNYIYKALSTFPNDPCFSRLYGLNNTGQTSGTPDADIDAPEAWDLRKDANDIIVAVIDTGVDYNHPDLAANMWSDGSGHHGYDYRNNDSDPMDDHLHGTHVAGIIGAVGNNASGVTGVCWNVKIMSLKFLYPYYIPGEGWVAIGDTYSAIACISYAVNNGAKILNNSWGGRPSDDPYEDLALKNAIESANAAGVLFVAAAGNAGYSIDYRPLYPAAFDCNNIISVMSTDANDNKSDFSCYGHISVDLAAPGTDIFSTFPTFQTSAMSYYGLSINYETISGTSMATPYVAGACALLWSYKPYLTHNEVKEGLIETVDKMPLFVDVNYYGGKYCVSEGRLNLHKALDYKPHRFVITKYEDVPEGNCILPEQYINYTISFSANGQNDSNVKVIDYLPDELDYNSSNLSGVYDANNRTVTWTKGTVSGSDSNTYTLRVRVNNLAEPCGVIPNLCKVEGDRFRNYT